MNTVLPLVSGIGDRSVGAGVYACRDDRPASYPVGYVDLAVSVPGR